MDYTVELRAPFADARRVTQLGRRVGSELSREFRSLTTKMLFVPLTLSACSSVMAAQDIERKVGHQTALALSNLPGEAQARISAMLGEDMSDYAIRFMDNEGVALNRAQQRWQRFWIFGFRQQ